MKKYVLGFAFSRDKKDMVLISKLRPEWQKGKLNGVGGKIEDGERRFHAMIREFKEETGVDTNFTNWQLFAKIVFDNNCQIDCFKLFDNLIYGCKTVEDEQIKIIAVDTALFNQPIMHNLPILIRIALSDEFNYCELTDREFFEST